MKIGILTHFGSFQSSYALHVGWHERAKLLQHFNQDFDFLVDQHCKEDLFPNQINALSKKVKTSKPFKDRAEYFRDLYKEVLKPYDVVLTADCMYQRKANFLAYNQGIRWASPHLKCKWFHWIHSGWTERPTPLPPYPDNLRYTFPEEGDHKIIYLNSWELNEVARMFNTSPANVACVYNPKDPRTFFDMSPMANKIVTQLRFWEKDIVQIFPHSAERMDAKGIDSIIRAFGALKRRGLEVAIVFANANSRSVQPEIKMKKDLMRDRYNLIENEDYIFTSDWTDLKPLPRKDVSDIFRLSNLFVFGSWRETVGNCYQEAKVNGCLLVLNDALPACRETGGKDAIFFQTDYKTPGRRDGMTGDLTLVQYQPDEFAYYDALAELIVARLSVMPKLIHRWHFCYEWIWNNQFKPLLYGSKPNDTRLLDGRIHIDGEDFSGELMAHQ